MNTCSTQNQLKHAFCSCNLQILRKKMCFFLPLISCGCLYSYIITYNMLLLYHFLSSFRHMPADEFGFFSLSKPYRAMILSHTKLRSCIPIGLAVCSSFAFLVWHKHTSCFHLSHSTLNSHGRGVEMKQPLVFTNETRATEETEVGEIVTEAEMANDETES